MRVLTLALATLTSVVTAATPVEEASASINRFTVDLYKAVFDGNDNLFLSPYSVAVALSMTRAGANGETASQMGQVLHHSGDSFTGYAELLAALQPSMVKEGKGDDLRETPAYEIHIANRLFGQQGLEFKPEFLAELEKVFAAPMERINFGDTEAARERINSWVEQETRERIKDILPPGMPPADCLLALANAIYFKASWEEQFKEKLTAPGDFFGSSKVQASFMTQTHSHNYAEFKGLQLLELMHKGGDTSVVFVLPRARDGLKSIESALDAATLDQWMKELKDTKVLVKLPRFEFDCPTNLTDVLPKMGMKLPFDMGKADFSKITTEEPLFIGAALHKGFIAVDENGTEAAAATVILMLRGAAPAPSKPVEFTADHPFLFLIRHRPTNTVLFIGRVTDPS